MAEAWTKVELETFWAMKAEGKPLAEIAEALGRDVKSVANKNYSLKKERKYMEQEQAIAPRPSDAQEKGAKQFAALGALWSDAEDFMRSMFGGTIKLVTVRADLDGDGETQLLINADADGKAVEMSLSVRDGGHDESTD